MNVRQSALVATLALAALPAFAQSAAPASDWTITGNAGLYSDYRFRGFSQTGYGPAFQGGFDVGHASGLYLGNWNSNVEQGLYNGASLEMDFYGGFKGAVGDFSYDVGGIYYYYPKSGAQGTTKISNGELYVGGGYGPFSVKYSYNVTSFFSIGKPPSYPDFDTKGSWYLDLTANFDLGNGFGVIGHYGYQKINNGKKLFAAGLTTVNTDNVGDYKLGITKDLSGWLLGAAVIGTTEKNLFTTAESGFSKGSGKTSVVVSLGKSF